MPDDLDWLMRPVLEQMCKLESVFDGTLSLHHIAMANDALNVRDENRLRAQKAIRDV